MKQQTVGKVACAIAKPEKTIERAFYCKKEALTYLKKTESELPRLFPETRAKNKIYPGEKTAGQHLTNMCVSVTEIFNNAINSGKFPISIRLARKGNSLFCIVQENGTFKNTTEISMNYSLTDHGRGMALAYAYSGKKIKPDGKNGLVMFEYVFGEDKERDRLIALSRKGKLLHMPVLVEPHFTHRIMAA